MGCLQNIFKGYQAKRYIFVRQGYKFTEIPLVQENLGRSCTFVWLGPLLAVSSIDQSPTRSDTFCNGYFTQSRPTTNPKQVKNRFFST